ncbi:hypothetical protein D3C72_1951760 [compost metagenome]
MAWRFAHARGNNHAFCTQGFKAPIARDDYLTAGLDIYHRGTGSDFTIVLHQIQNALGPEVPFHRPVERLHAERRVTAMARYATRLFFSFQQQNAVYAFIP